MSDACARPGLLSVEDARRRLLSAVQAIEGVDHVSLRESAGRVLAEDVVARVDVPPAANSAMDGYAMRLSDLLAAPGHRLPVSQRIPAGQVPAPLLPGTAARIFTGAEIPEGADLVVMQEDCRAGDGEVSVDEGTVASLASGDNIRPQGQDIRSGQVVLACGARLGPAAIGMAAAAGHAGLTVRRRLRVAILSTGDELLEPGAAPQPGRIYNSNRYALAAWLESLGCTVVDLGVIPDQRDRTIQALQEAADAADIVLTTGGASVGEEDHLGAALRAVGHVDLWKIAIKPGKPLLFGRVRRPDREVPLVGLPGNPVSVAVTFLVLARPVLRVMQGGTGEETPLLRLPAGFSVRRPGGRAEYLRVRFEAGRLVRYPNQSSGVLMSMAWADGLAVVPAGSTVQEGDLLNYLPFAWLLDAG